MSRLEFLLVVLTGVGAARANWRSDLRPQDSETRETRSLDGLWKFRTTPAGADPELGFREKWMDAPLSRTKGAAEEVIEMPVPSSYNDVTQDRNIRDFVGWVWYETEFFVPPSWTEGGKKRILLRFGSVSHTAVAYVNGHELVRHVGGHLPFQAEIDLGLLSGNGAANRLTVAVNNTLTPTTVPQGKVVHRAESDFYPKGYRTLEYTFDFFNYAGIHRPVVLHAVPAAVSVVDVRLAFQVAPDLKSAVVFYDVDVHVDPKFTNYSTWTKVEMLDSEGVALPGTSVSLSAKGNLTLNNPRLWWPHTMNKDAGYLHTLRVSVHNQAAGDDVYRLPVGVRSVDWNSTGVHINHKKFYFRGFGKHEDSDIRGKGLDLPTSTKDFNLLRWSGANSFRTSHYPYAEEIMDLADRAGMVVIDECPAVNLQGFGDDLLEAHKRTLTEMVGRDKNRASVVMWSVANEPRSTEPEAEQYFRKVAAHLRMLDKTRPMTVVLNADPASDKAAQFADVVGINRYFGWYSDPGHVELVARQMTAELRRWHRIRKKPVIVTEYGADTVAGLHQDPSFVFTEEFQTDVMTEYFKAFDTARKEGILAGEMIWNFADFMTGQSIMRVVGNKKGVFTRQRQPKASAHLLRRRYWWLAHQDAPKFLLLDREGFSYAPPSPYAKYDLTCYA